MDITSTLLGIAGGGVGTSLVNWLAGRRKAAGDEQVTVTDVATKYWLRIDELERRMGEMQLKVATLEAENAMLKLQLGVGIVTP